MTNYNDTIAFTDTLTNFGEDGSFSTVTIAVSKSSISGVVVCFDAATASYRISNPINVSKTNDYADVIFVHMVCCFAETDDIKHDVWLSLVRLVNECDEAYGC